MTRRQEIIELLKENPISAQNLANIYGTTLKDINEDLEHIKLAVKSKFRIIPAYCKKCNYIFKERAKIKTPSKCPKCRSEWIEREKFKIKG